MTEIIVNSIQPRKGTYICDLQAGEIGMILHGLCKGRLIARLSRSYKPEFIMLDDISGDLPNIPQGTEVTKIRKIEIKPFT